MECSRNVLKKIFAILEFCECLNAQILEFQEWGKRNFYKISNFKEFLAILEQRFAFFRMCESGEKLIFRSVAEEMNFSPLSHIPKQGNCSIISDSDDWSIFHH